MDIQKLAKRLEGLQTISTASKILGTSRRTSVNYISRLRKAGYVETSYGHNKVRRYRITSVKRRLLGNDGLIETINKNSKVNLVLPYNHRVYNHEINVEEALVRAINSGKFRVVLASLGLFNKVKNWQLLCKMAKEEKIGRKLGALYDVARCAIRVRKMDKRTRKALMRSIVSSRFIIPNFKSRTFLDIENKWKIYIPFNAADLEVYKE